MSLVIGIDEAGVGPILGPMTVSGVLMDSARDQTLIDCGVRDSKLFGSLARSRQARQRVFDLAMPYICQYHTELISAEMLDCRNMYDLEIEAIGIILNRLGWERADIIYIAQIGQTRRETFLTKLAFYDQAFSRQDFRQRVIYEIDADAKFVSVGLASLAAKTRRDTEVLALCELVGESYISGYPNRVTAAFLFDYFRRHGKLFPELRLNRDWQALKVLKEMVG